VTTRLIRLLVRLSKETGAKYEDLAEAAKLLTRQNPKITPNEIDRLLRAAERL
jgi:hypothetical protein